MTAQAVISKKLAWIENTVAPTLVHFSSSFDKGSNGLMWLIDLIVKHADRDLPRSLKGVPIEHLKRQIVEYLEKNL